MAGKCCLKLPPNGSQNSENVLPRVGSEGPVLANRFAQFVSRFWRQERMPFASIPARGGVRTHGTSDRARLAFDFGASVNAPSLVIQAELWVADPKPRPSQAAESAHE